MALEAGLLVRRAENSLALDERTYLGKGISMLMRALPAYAAQKAAPVKVGELREDELKRPERDR